MRRDVGILMTTRRMFDVDVSNALTISQLRCALIELASHVHQRVPRALTPLRFEYAQTRRHGDDGSMSNARSSMPITLDAQV
jgi:hypothetical protein